MSRKRYTPEQIISMLREADRGLGAGPVRWSTLSHATAYGSELLIAGRPRIVSAFELIVNERITIASPRRCKKGPLGGCGLVPAVHGRAPRATRRALNRLTRRLRAGGTCGPTGSSVGWVVGSVSQSGFDATTALVEPVAVTVHLELLTWWVRRSRSALGEKREPNTSVPFVEGQIGGDQGQSPARSVRLNTSQQPAPVLDIGIEAEFVDDQKLVGARASSRKNLSSCLSSRASMSSSTSAAGGDEDRPRGPSAGRQAETEGDVESLAGPTLPSAMRFSRRSMVHRSAPAPGPAPC